jgi:predicted benzoate:H+ symporter BenE
MRSIRPGVFRLDRAPEDEPDWIALVSQFTLSAARQREPADDRMSVSIRSYCLPQFCCSSTTSVALPIAAIVCASV